MIIIVDEAAILIEGDAVSLVERAGIYLFKVVNKNNTLEFKKNN